MHRSSIVCKLNKSKTDLNKEVDGFCCERVVKGDRPFHWRPHHYYYYYYYSYYGLFWTEGTIYLLPIYVLIIHFVTYKHAAFHFTRC